MFPLSARIVTLEELFLVGRFAPAAVQRDYRWGQRQCDALLGDLMRAFHASGLAPATPALEAEGGSGAVPAAATDQDDDADEEPWLLPDTGPPAPEPEEPAYYLGAAMLLPDGVPRDAAHGPAPRHLVYDGLQRLTTLTVLLACLRDWSEPAPPGLDALILAPDGGPRLILDFADHTLTHDVQRPGATRARWRHAEGLTDAGRRLREAVALTRREISRLTQEERIAFALFLRTRVLFSLIELANPRLAAQVFVTTNDRGLALDRGDVLKGQVVELVGTGPGGEEAAQATALAWTQVASAAGDAFEPLLRASDFIARTRPQGPDCLQRFFADHIAPRLGPVGAAAWVKGALMEHAGALALVRAQAGLEDAAGIHASCRRLSLLPFDEWLPVALLFALRRKPQRAERDMADLANASVMVLLKGYSARDRATIYGRAVRQMRERRNPFNGALSFDADARRAAAAALAAPIHEPDSRAALVRWLESLLWPDALPATIASRGCTVEHILPVRPRRDSEWLDDFPDPEERAALTDSLGNLALIPGDVNEALGNRDFEEKREKFARLRLHYRLLEGLQQVPRWTPEALRARTQRLKALAMTALGLTEG